MKHIIFYILFIVLPINVYCQIEDELISTKLVKDGVFYPNDLTVVGEFIFLKDLLESTGEYGIKIYERRSGVKIKEFLRPGRGPSEYLSFNIRKGRESMTLEVSDNKNKKNDTYSVECIISLPADGDLTKCLKESIPNYTTREAIIVDDNLILNTSSEVGGINFLSNREKIIDYVTEVPDKIEEKYSNSYTGGIAMAGYLVGNFKRNKFAYFGRYYDQSIFFLYQNGIFNEYKNNHYSHLPELDIINIGGNRIVEPSDKAKFGFLSPVSDSSNIYVLYSGQTLDDVPRSDDIEWRALTTKIKVFDWEGAEVSEFKVDYPLLHIAVSEDGEYLYGVALTDEDSMVLEVVTYSLGRLFSNR